MLKDSTLVATKMTYINAASPPFFEKSTDTGCIPCYFEKKYVEIILKLICIICAYFLEKYIEKYNIFLDTFSKHAKIILYIHKLYIVFP
jgi:hypothetical protein